LERKEQQAQTRVDASGDAFGLEELEWFLEKKKSQSVHCFERLQKKTDGEGSDWSEGEVQ